MALERNRLSSGAIELVSPQENARGVEYWYDPETGKVFYKHTRSMGGPNTGGDQIVFIEETNKSKADALINANRSKLDLDTREEYEGGYEVGKIAARNDETLRYPSNSKNSDFVLFEFYKYAPPWKTNTADYDQKKNNQYIKSENLKSISLYMPEDISTGFRANWTGKSLSNISSGALRAAGAGTEGKFGDALKEGGETISQFFNQTAGPLAGAIILQKATTKLTGDSLTLDDIFGGIAGQVLNPNTELLYNGPDLRNFTLNFRLVPRNGDKEEAAILDIIKTFKKAMLPTARPNSNARLDSIVEGNSSPLSFIGVPDLVKVTFFVKGQISKTLPSFKMCSIISTDVNYTPDGSYATYTSGNPVAYDLSISFQETKVVYRENIGNGVN